MCHTAYLCESIHRRGIFSDQAMMDARKREENIPQSDKSWFYYSSVERYFSVFFLVEIIVNEHRYLSISRMRSIAHAHNVNMHFTPFRRPHHFLFSVLSLCLLSMLCSYIAMFPSRKLFKYIKYKTHSPSVCTYVSTCGWIYIIILFFLELMHTTRGGTSDGISCVFGRSELWTTNPLYHLILFLMCRRA